MHPVGFYDLREAAASAVPVVSTAFRPVDGEELARNPFRVFTSLLTPADPRFFDADLRARLETFLAGRELFPPELLALADRAEADGELPEADAERFLHLAVQAFELSPEPVDQAWYATLERVSAVAADIGGVRSTHINHLTPRVLDIDELYRRMTDARHRDDRRHPGPAPLEGPRRPAAPDLLPRARRAPRAAHRRTAASISGALRVRFGEVEARGIALTREGRARYDRLLARVDGRAAGAPGRPEPNSPAQVWQRHSPTASTDSPHAGLALLHLPRARRPPAGRQPPARRRALACLEREGWVRAEPVVYEDFLPRSAAGIFQSNLSDEGSRNNDGSRAPPTTAPGSPAPRP